ncbi:Rnaseh2a protein [Chytriomyces sp. MP71]|nr:Rnaseh2a protein [Chytriomyces sp. MP71]
MPPFGRRVAGADAPSNTVEATDNCTTEFVLGVDEAGRGPVLGPMVYALAFAPVGKKAEVKAIGVDDSKRLTDKDRERLFSKMMRHDGINQWLGFAVTAISPRAISEGMLRRTKYNLNAQAYDTTIALIRATLNRGVNVTEIYVDTVGKEKPYQAVLEGEFPGIAITVTTKADSKFPIVSAASIFAKVIRDHVVQHWTFSERGIALKPFTRTFGSGYPGDPNTRKWLRENLDPVFGYPEMIRFSWSTAANMLKKAVEIRW